jgi:hypothetical protein
MVQMLGKDIVMKLDTEVVVLNKRYLQKLIEIWAFYYGKKFSNISNIYNDGTPYMMKVVRTV